jgi:hypothetical protein
MSGLASAEAGEAGLRAVEVLSSPTAGTLAAQADALIDERLRAGGEVCFTISSGSMWPALAPGDEVTVRGARADEVCPGDLLFRQVGGMWLAHRLIERRSAGGIAQLITKGDNSPHADAPWPAERLRGVVVAARRDRLDTEAARRQGAWLARLSRAQAVLWQPDAGWPRRLAVRGMGVVLRAAGALARRRIE